MMACPVTFGTVARQYTTTTGLECMVEQNCSSYRQATKTRERKGLGPRYSSNDRKHSH
jgi:hypothetical protein